MQQDRYCENCKVHVSSDLTNCPLCGKHIIKNGETALENKRTYPRYSFRTFQHMKWYNILRGMFWITAIICVVVNLCFKTTPYWFPYVLAALVMIFRVFIEPIKLSVKAYIKELCILGILVGMFLIFIDAYNYYTLKTAFGWALAYSAPMIIMATVLACFVICLCSRIYEVQLLRSITLVGIFSIIYFLVVFFAFRNLPIWPSLTLMCVSLGSIGVLEIFKRNKLIRELKKEFHI